MRCTRSRLAAAPAALLMLALSTGCSARQKPPAEPVDPAAVDPAPTLDVDPAGVDPAPNIFKPAPSEPVVRNVPYGGAFGPSDPPKTPLPPDEKPLSAEVRAALDVWYQRPSPKGPEPIPVAQPKAIYVVGKSPVVQILPGPAVFPEELSEKYKITRPDSIPYSNNTRRLPRGEIRFVSFDNTVNDTKLSRDSMEIDISFTDYEGAEWRIEQVALAPISSNPIHEPWFGGVVIDTLFHGHSGHASPALPLVRCMMCSYGWADVYKNGKKVASSALLHIMLTSDSRDDSRDFHYVEYDATKNPIRQVHIDAFPMNHLPSPGGFLHLTWENSEWKVGTPEEIKAIAPKMAKDLPTIEISAVPHLRWDRQEIHLKAGQKYRLLVHNSDPASFHQFRYHPTPEGAGHHEQPKDLRHEHTATAGRTGPLWKPGDPGYTRDKKENPPTPRDYIFPLPQGSTWATIVQFDKPGEYEFMCPVGNHMRRGMHGKFVVTADGGEGLHTPGEKPTPARKDRGGAR
jgi:hypothetical protein